MAKTMVGPRLRRLRRERRQTQAEMAAALGVSASYVNLLENNQRSLSVQMLMTISEVYGVDWRDLTRDEASRSLADLRTATLDPALTGERPDLQELRAAIDHAPLLADMFVRLREAHREALAKIMKLGDSGVEGLTESSPEARIHDVFRSRQNHFPDVEAAAEAMRARHAHAPEDHYAALKTRLAEDHGVSVQVRAIETMDDALRIYDADANLLLLSQALDGTNRVFQLVQVLCLIEHAVLLDAAVAESGITHRASKEMLRAELANYFAAAYLMPYAPFLKVAERARYDLDRIATAFSVSFEQVCQRVTTLQREGARGVPFFFLRVDRAGNVTKRFSATSFALAEHGGACPVWNIHAAFYTPGVILPQFVETPEGERFFTISRTVHRAVYNRQTQDRRLTLALGCRMEDAGKIGYAAPFNLDDPGLFAPIGINCHLCPRQSCPQRAHQPLFVDLPMDANRRGGTRFEG